jgi:hypothetical protein
MTLITQHDFDSQAGQTKIITEIHRLDRKVHDLELAVKQLTQGETAIERELEGPEAY